MQVNPNMKFVVPFTVSQAQRVIDILVQQPFKDVADLIVLIKQLADHAVAKSQEESTGTSLKFVPDSKEATP